MEKLLTRINELIISKVGAYLGYILKTNFNIHNNYININYVGVNNNIDSQLILKRELAELVVLIDNNYIHVKLNDIEYYQKSLYIQFIFSFITNYHSYFEFLPKEIIAEILKYLSYQEFINTCKLPLSICDNPELYLYLIFTNYNHNYKLIKTIESIDSVNYSKEYKDYYLSLICINCSKNELYYRLRFYEEYSGVYYKVNKYMNSQLFVNIMKSYEFPDLKNKNIYSIYAETGIIDEQYCEDDYMDTKLDIDQILECIVKSNNRIYSIQKKIIPWIQMNDILTWFMLVDLINETNDFSDIIKLRKLVEMKYKSNKFVKELLNEFDNNVNKIIH